MLRFNLMLRLMLITVLLAPILAGCIASSTPPGDSPGSAALTQWSGAQGGTATFFTREVRDAATWNALWRQLGREPPPPFDASREMALAIFLGERRTAGYRIEVVAVRDEAGRRVAEYRELTPAPGKVVSQVLTRPWAVVVFAQSDRPVIARKISAGPQAAP